MKKIIALAVLLVSLLVLPCTEATVYSIFPDGNKTIECDGENHTVECIPNIVCSIDRTLVGNETYDFHEGVCDIHFECESPLEESEGLVEFPMKIFIENRDNRSNVNFTIWDWAGNIHQEFHQERPFTSKGSIEEDVFFTCPADINTDINIETCSKYFDRILQKGDPLLFQLATGQSECTEELIKCQGDLLAKQSELGFKSVSYQERVDETINAKAELIRCEEKLDPNSPNSTVRQYINEANSKVPPFWMHLSGILGLIIIIIAVIFIFRKP